MSQFVLLRSDDLQLKDSTVVLALLEEQFVTMPADLVFGKGNLEEVLVRLSSCGVCAAGSYQNLGISMTKCFAKVKNCLT